MTPNDNIPETIQEQIKADAQLYTKDEGYQRSYIAGATAWAGWKVKFDELKAQAQRMADALEEINKVIDKTWNECNTKAIPDKYKKEISAAQALSYNILQQFKDSREEVKNEQV